VDAVYLPEIPRGSSATSEPLRPEALPVVVGAEESPVADLRPGYLVDADIDRANERPTVRSTIVARPTPYGFPSDVEPVFKSATECGPMRGRPATRRAAAWHATLTASQTNCSSPRDALAYGRLLVRRERARRVPVDVDPKRMPRVGASDRTGSGYESRGSFTLDHSTDDSDVETASFEFSIHRAQSESDRAGDTWLLRRDGVGWQVPT